MLLIGRDDPAEETYTTAALALVVRKGDWLAKFPTELASGWAIIKSRISSPT
jgi:hypothetical protein